MIKAAVKQMLQPWTAFLLVVMLGFGEVAVAQCHAAAPEAPAISAAAITAAKAELKAMLNADSALAAKIDAIPVKLDKKKKAP